MASPARWRLRFRSPYDVSHGSADDPGGDRLPRDERRRVVRVVCCVVVLASPRHRSYRALASNSAKRPPPSAISRPCALSRSSGQTDRTARALEPRASTAHRAVVGFRSVTPGSLKPSDRRDPGCRRRTDSDLNLRSAPSVTTSVRPLTARNAPSRRAFAPGTP